MRETLTTLALVLCLGACAGEEEGEETTTATDETYTTAGDESLAGEEASEDEPPEPFYDDPS